MKNQMHKTISQSAVFVVCAFASLFLTFYFSSIQLDTLNDLMRDENLTHYEAVCTDVLLLSSFLSFLFLLITKEGDRTHKQTMHTIEMLTRLLSADIRCLSMKGDSVLFTFHLIPSIIKN